MRLGNLRHLQGLDPGGDSRVDDREHRRMRGRLRGRKRFPFAPDHAEQRVERLGELLDPVVLQHPSDVGEIHPARCQPFHDQVGLTGIIGEGSRRGPVFLEEPKRRRRHGIDRVGADERLHIEDVGVARVLGAGAGPEESLGPGPGGGQPLPGGALEVITKPGVGQLRVGDRDLAPEVEQRPALGLDTTIGLGVHPAHEERGHRGQSVHGLAGPPPSLECPHIGLRHLAIVVQGEEQGDVDVDPFREQALDSGPAFPGAGHFDHQVGPIHLGPEAASLRDRPVGVAGQRG